MTEHLKKIYEMQAAICQALSHPVRLHILDLISSQEMTSTDLLEVLQIPKANLSQHLSVLKEAGIIKTKKEGQFSYISLAIPKIKDACRLVGSILVEKLNEEERLMNELKKGIKVQEKSTKKKTTKRS